MLSGFSANAFFIRNQKVVLLVLEFLGLLLSLFLAHNLLEFKIYGILPQESLALWIAFLFFSFISQVAILQIADLYTLPSKYRKLLFRQSVLLLFCQTLLFSLLAIFCYASKFALGRDVLVCALAFNFVFSLGIRGLFLKYLSLQYDGLIKPIQCLLLGQNPLSEELVKQKEFTQHYQIGNLSLADESLGADLLRQIVKEQGTEIILLNSTELPNQVIDELVKLKFKGLQVIDLATFYENLTGRVPLLHLSSQWFLNTKVFNQVNSFAVLRAKRLFDLSFVILSLPVVLPVILLSALIIKLSSPGKVIYAQKRIGIFGKIFTVYKLRSMTDSKQVNPDWTRPQDSRITAFGKIIRSTRIDELPQLWNILRGEMSLIGPRPERPEIVEDLRTEIPFYDLRLSVLPGISGFSQINEPLATPSDSLKKLERDLFYIRHLSFGLELDIILKTIRIILMGKGN